MTLENSGSFRGNLANVSSSRNRHVSRKSYLHPAVALIIVFCLMVITAGQVFGQAPPFRPVVYAGTATGWLYRISFDATQFTVDWSVSGLNRVECVAVSRNGDYIAVGTSNSLSLFTATGIQLWSIPIGVASRWLVEQSQVAINDYGNYIVAAHRDGTVRLYDLVGIELWKSKFNAKSVAITWDGLHVFAGGRSGAAYYNEGGNRWDPSDGTTPVWTDTSSAVLTVAISEDTNFPIYMVSGGDRNGLVKLYDTTPPPLSSLIWAYTNPLGGLMSVDINSMGTDVIAGNDDPSNWFGAQLDLFKDTCDGVPGWTVFDGTPVWTYTPSPSPQADCRAVDFGSWPSGVEFSSGGTSGYNIYKHSASATSTPLWIGTLPPAREVESIDLVNAYNSWIVSSETSFPEVLIWDAGGVSPSPPLYTVLTNGNVMSVSASAFSTNITVTGDIILNVPDEDQPPFSLSTNWCAPTAAINVLDYWDRVMGWAPGLLDGWWRSLASDYLGWFMDTNRMGSPARLNGPHMGTYHKDVWPGINEFAAWSPFGNPFLVPFVPPMSKVPYTYTGTVTYINGFQFIVGEISAGRPLIISFAYWNPDRTNETLVTVVSARTQLSDTAHFCDWGPPVGGSGPPDPEEEWEDDPNPEFGIGHAVTCVGYIEYFDPDGADGPLPLDDWVIVHDNWPTTPVNVAIPWNSQWGINWRKGVSVRNLQ